MIPSFLGELFLFFSCSFCPLVGGLPAMLHMSAVPYFVLLRNALVWMDSSLFIPAFLALGTTATGASVLEDV